MCLSNCLNLHFTTVVFVLFVFSSSSSWGSNDMVCIQKGPCNCTTEDGGVIDLTPLSTKLEPLISSSESYLYIYNPCTDRIFNSVVKNSCNKGYGLCYFTPNKTTTKPISLADVIVNKTFGNFERLALNEEGVIRTNENDELEVVYKNILNETVVTSIIRLHCDETIHNYRLAVEKSQKNLHVLSLSSRYACKKLPHHMSGAAVFFLILFIVIAMYFIGGVLVLKFIRGAKGVEMIPNHEFWCSIPGVAKVIITLYAVEFPIKVLDSFAYLKNCFRQEGNVGPDTYERI